MSTSLAVEKNVSETEQNEYPLKVKNFTYNGFYGRVEKGYASYTAKFSKWTNDPGITVCACSDGKERLIPTFAFESCVGLPKQIYAEHGPDLFGCASKS